MNKTLNLKYRLGTTEIIAFIISMIAVVMMQSYNVGNDLTDGRQIIEFVAVLSFFSALFGPIIGGLTGFLGVAIGCSMAGVTLLYCDAVAMTVYGVLVGQYASKYGIRDGKFARRQIFLLLVTQAMACIVALVFIKPFADFILHGRSLTEALSEGMRNALYCGGSLNVSMVVLFYIINIFFKNEKH